VGIKKSINDVQRPVCCNVVDSGGAWSIEMKQ
jgi:hypothetical protein